MADHGTTAKTAGLKKSFSEFFELKDLVGRVKEDADIINRLNLKVGGHDEIGKQYHTQVDEGTKNLHDLIAKIGSTMLSVGENGEVLADTLDRADDDSHTIANGF
ncbi:hypothetical protein ACFP3U_27420 [Kitasatospora misakiensis]|uniref:Uncharacterized protein n=1 Tax=Kitasatospora misakiensis TaxID=67330 RepID=A0ABW0XBK6_9ACTN